MRKRPAPTLHNLKKNEHTHRGRGGGSGVTWQQHTLSHWSTAAPPSRGTRYQGHAPVPQWESPPVTKHGHKTSDTTTQHHRGGARLPHVANTAPKDQGTALRTPAWCKHAAERLQQCRNGPGSHILQMWAPWLETQRLARHPSTQPKKSPPPPPALPPLGGTSQSTALVARTTPPNQIMRGGLGLVDTAL